MSPRAFPDDSIDTLIADRLPNWLRQASAAQVVGLRQALIAEQQAQHAVHTLLVQIQPLDTFAAPLLTAALGALMETPPDVHRARLVRAVHIRFPSGVATIPDGIVKREFEHSLLEAALHNFALAETAQKAWLPRSKLVDGEGGKLALEPRAFAGVCRSLDIGGLYQQHLKTVLFGDDQLRRHNEQLLEEGWRTALQAAAWTTHLQGAIDAAALTGLQSTWTSSPLQSVVAASTLHVLGFPLRGLVLFELAGGAGLIAWMPGDRHAVLSVHVRLSALSEALGERLRHAEYRQSFLRFIAEADRVPFMAALNRALEQAGSQRPAGLGMRQTPIQGSVFAHLRRTQIDGWLDDACVLAAPTTFVEPAERDRRLHLLMGLGLDLMGLASFFVPALGLPLLAIGAVQLGEEVYEGYRDWRLGDRESALGHLFAVAGNLALFAATAGAGVALERVAQVDALAAVRCTDGKLRLTRTDLLGYASERHTLASGERVRLDGSRFLGTDAGTFRLAEDGPDAAIVHGRRATAAAIALEDNHAGGVRHALQRPQDWASAGQLMRSLSVGLRQVDDTEATVLLRTVGMDTAQLRRLHLENAAPPARLADAARRYAVNRQFPRLRGEALEAHLRESQRVPSSAAAPLQRAFPGLTINSAEELVSQATEAQRAALREQQRVPLALAERARWALHDARLDRACAGFEHAAAVNSDTERLALELMQAWSPWPANTRIEVREGGRTGLQRAVVGPTDATTVIQLVSGKRGYSIADTAGQRLPSSRASDGLFQALLQVLSPEQRNALSDAVASPEALAEALARRASAQREALAGRLGMAPIGVGIRPPQRIGDGRIGYLLSGRGEGSRRALLHGYQQVFPTYSDMEIEVYLETIRLRGLMPWPHLEDLHQQLHDLKRALVAWRQAATHPTMIERRRVVARRIRHCWRRKRAEVDGTFHLVLDDERLGSLPALPAGVTFDHVSRLSLRRLYLTELEPEFIARFNQLRTLDLRDNALETVPSGVQRLTSLTGLNLAGNRIVLDAPGLRRLSALTQLHTLDLTHNPIGQLPPIHDLPALQRLSLRDTGLTEVPISVYLHPNLEDIDLRDNHIEALSPTLAHSRRRLAGLSLHDNPVSETQAEGARASLGERAGFVLPARRHGPGGQASLERWLAGFDAVESALRSQQWAALAEEADSGDLMRFFHDLGRTQDYDLQGIDLRRRVWQIIEACVSHTEVREAVVQQAAGPRTCADQMLLILSLLEVRALVVARTSGLAPEQAAGALTQLGRELYRLDAVDRYVTQRIVEARVENPFGLLDEVEVHLAYRAGLVVPLGLPAQARYMYYRNYSDVGTSQLRRAANAILQAETEADIAASLVARDFWSTFLRTRYSLAFERMNRPFHRHLEALLEQSGKLPEQALLDAVEALAQSRVNEETALMMTLTQGLLAVHPWNPAPLLR